MCDRQREAHPVASKRTVLESFPPPCNWIGTRDRSGKKRALTFDCFATEPNARRANANGARKLSAARRVRVAGRERWWWRRRFCFRDRLDCVVVVLRKRFDLRCGLGRFDFFGRSCGAWCRWSGACHGHIDAHVACAGFSVFARTAGVPDRAEEKRGDDRTVRARRSQKRERERRENPSASSSREHHVR